MDDGLVVVMVMTADLIDCAMFLKESDWFNEA